MVHFPPWCRCRGFEVRWGIALSMVAPATRQRAATPMNGTAGGQEAAKVIPAPRLVRTTKVEKTPWARAMTGRPVMFSARPATAFIVTSAAPLEAPATPSPMQRLGRFTAVRARPAPTMPSRPMAPAATFGPQRSSALPASSIAGRAPAPTNRRANPSRPSLTSAWCCTRGTEAPQTPQNEPKAAKATNAEVTRLRDEVMGASMKVASAGSGELCDIRKCWLTRCSSPAASFSYAWPGRRPRGP